MFGNVADTDLLDVAIKAEDVKHPVGVNLERLQTVDHHDRGLGMGAVFAWRGRRRHAVLPSVALASSAPARRGAHGRAHAALVVAPVAVVLIAVVPACEKTHETWRWVTRLALAWTQHCLTATVDFGFRLKLAQIVPRGLGSECVGVCTCRPGALPYSGGWCPSRAGCLRRLLE